MRGVRDIFAGLGLMPPPSSSPEFISEALWDREQMQDHQEGGCRASGPDATDFFAAITIDGSEQWLHIRGRNKDNPLLLYLHVGPCAPIIGWIDETTRP